MHLSFIPCLCTVHFTSYSFRHIQQYWCDPYRNVICSKKCYQTTLTSIIKTLIVCHNSLLPILHNLFHQLLHARWTLLLAGLRRSYLPLAAMSETSTPRVLPCLLLTGNSLPPTALYSPQSCPILSYPTLSCPTQPYPVLPNPPNNQLSALITPLYTYFTITFSILFVSSFQHFHNDLEVPVTRYPVDGTRYTVSAAC